MFKILLKLFQFPGLKTMKQMDKMKQLAVVWNNWKKSEIFSKCFNFQCKNETNGRNRGNLFDYQRCKNVINKYKLKMINESWIKSALLHLFHFRGLKNVKEMEKMKQKAVKQLAVRTDIWIIKLNNSINIVSVSFIKTKIQVLKNYWAKIILFQYTTIIYIHWQLRLLKFTKRLILVVIQITVFIV